LSIEYDSTWKTSIERSINLEQSTMLGPLLVELVILLERADRRFGQIYKIISQR
jgi:hypothetical protein